MTSDHAVPSNQTPLEMAMFQEMNPGPVVRTDGEGRVLLANAAARELFGRDGMIGRSWKEILPGMDEPLWQRILESPDVVRAEGKLGERSFVFAHRRAPESGQIFIFGNDVTALRAAEDRLRQMEKMATLGTLAAGVAHELNNPAAAAARGASQLREAFGKLQDALLPLTQISLAGERAAELFGLVKEDRERATQVSYIDPLTRSDLEGDVESWLEEHDVEGAWELAPSLVSMGYTQDDLEKIAGDWGGDTAAVLGWIARAQPVLALSREIEEATRRISEIVKSLKTYSFLGQTSVKAVDVIEGIESTLVMLRNKLKNGITIIREYDEALPAIDAYGAELNQVWTNLIDNAADALGGKGTITLRARRDGADGIIVEVEDDGPGMSPSVQQCVFDPFFTTKDPGKGTGLGLSTSRNIVDKRHGGRIDVTSRPGRTTFTVWLPLRLAANAEPND